MVYASRFGFAEPFGVLASLEMTTKLKERKKRLAAAKPPKNAPLFSTSSVMSTEGRHLLKPIIIRYIIFLLRFDLSGFQNLTGLYWDNPTGFSKPDRSKLKQSYRVLKTQQDIRKCKR